MLDWTIKIVIVVTASLLLFYFINCLISIIYIAFGNIYFDPLTMLY